MRAQANRLEDKKYLQRLSEVLDISENRIRLDECGDWNLISPNGIISTETEYWYLYVSPLSIQKWTWIKKRLFFMEVSQDGDDEGILKLNRMPAEDEAEQIRKVIGGHRRTKLTEERLAKLLETSYKPSPEGVVRSHVDLNRQGGTYAA